MDYSRFLVPQKEANEPYITRILAMRAFQLPNLISLAGGLPNKDVVPIVGCSFTCADGTTLTVDKDEMKKASTYQSTKGNPKTLSWIHKIHAKYHNPPILNDGNPNKRFSTVVTPGCMGAMHLLFRLTVETDDVVLLEEFSFGGTKKNMRLCGGELVGLKMDEQGIRTDDLKDALTRWQQRVSVASGRKLRKPRLLYTVPTGHNPTGVTTSFERKKEIYKIAQEHDLLIIEDDPYFYLQYSEDFVPSYQSLDTDGRVIRLDSMSKLAAPGFRVGWVTGPDAIIREIVAAQTCCSISISSLTELAIMKLFDHWGMDGFHQHINYLRDFYQKLRDRTEQMMHELLTDLIEWKSPEAGLYIWAKLKNNQNSLIFADMEFCEKHDVFVVPGVDFSCDLNNATSYFRICFTYTNQQEEAIKRLRNLVVDINARQ